MCLLSLLTTDTTFVTWPVFLSSGLPIRSAAGFPRKILKFTCILNTEINSGNVRLVLLSLKYLVVSFGTQNKIVLLFAAPPVRLTSPFFHGASSH